jgi:hypothetical protein
VRGAGGRGAVEVPVAGTGRGGEVTGRGRGCPAVGARAAGAARARGGAAEAARARVGSGRLVAGGGARAVAGGGARAAAEGGARARWPWASARRPETIARWRTRQRAGGDESRA